MKNSAFTSPFQKITFVFIDNIHKIKVNMKYFGLRINWKAISTILKLLINSTVSNKSALKDWKPLKNCIGICTNFMKNSFIRISNQKIWWLIVKEIFISKTSFSVIFLTLKSIYIKRLLELPYLILLKNHQYIIFMLVHQ